MPKGHDIRLQPTRDQRRELDRAAKGAGLRHTGPWVLSVALAAARVWSGTQGASVASKHALAPVLPQDTAVTVQGIGIPGPTADGKPLPLIHADGRPVKARDLLANTMVEYDTRTGVIKEQSPAELLAKHRLTRSYDPDLP